MENSKKLIRLSVSDNVLVVCDNLKKGEVFHYGKLSYSITEDVSLGHKIAFKAIKKGEKIIKFKMSIGSATKDINAGEHIHLHNIKSDFIPTYTIDNQEKTFE